MLDRGIAPQHNPHSKVGSGEWFMKFSQQIPQDLLDEGQDNLLSGPREPPTPMKTSSIRWWYLSAAVALVFGFVSCKQSGAESAIESDRAVAWWEGEQEREDLAQAVQLARYRVSQMPADRRGDLARVNREIATLKVRLGEVRKIHAALEVEEVAIRQHAERYAAMVREQRRMDAVGTKMALFKPAIGRALEDVEITAVTDAGVTLRHRGGIARVDFFKLSQSQRERFGLEFAAAVTALDQENAREMAFHQATEAAMASQREQEAREATEAAKRAADQARMERALAPAQATRPGSILAQSAGRPNGTQRVSRADRWHSYYSRPTIYYYPYYPVSPCTPRPPIRQRLPITPTTPTTPATPPSTGGSPPTTPPTTL